jgi:hypothetical protein
LNMQIVQVLSTGLSSSQYEFNFSNAGFSSASDVGTAIPHSQYRQCFIGGPANTLTNVGSEEDVWSAGNWLTALSTRQTSGQNGLAMQLSTNSTFTNQGTTNLNGTTNINGSLVFSGSQFGVPNGTTAAPGLYFDTHLNAGLGAVNQFRIFTILNGNEVEEKNATTNVETVTSANGFGWANHTGNDFTNPDTAIWSPSANVVNVGTGSANNATGTLSFALWKPGIIYSAAGTALPTCNAGAKGTMAIVSDATTPTYNATYTSGGAVAVPVFCNGTSWTTH